MSEEKNKETKAKEIMYKAADKVGHVFRKTLPYLAAIAVGFVINLLTGKDKDDSTSA